MELQCVVLYTVVEKPTPIVNEKFENDVVLYTPNGDEFLSNGRKIIGSQLISVRPVLPAQIQTMDDTSPVGCLDWIKIQIKRFLCAL